MPYKTAKFPGNSKGFSIIELILYISLSAIILGVTSQIMRNHVDAYSFITNRHSALSDAGYALDRIVYELLRIETADIISIDGDSIEFVDKDNNPASFKLAANGSNMALFRGNELMVSPVQSFSIKYYDLNGNVTAVIGDIRKFEVGIVTAPVASEGSITLSTMVTPRPFLYENYQ